MPASPPTGRDLTLRGRTFAPGQTALLAIINRTPDSFYDQGMFLDDDVALDAVDRAVAEGADAVDLGGVKAGPGPEVDADEEERRVVPFLQAVREKYPDLIISVDTWRRRTAPCPPACARTACSSTPRRTSARTATTPCGSPAAWRRWWRPAGRF